MLFVHQNFPGQFLHLARHLAAERAHDLVAIGEPNQGTLPGVRQLSHEPERPPDGVHRDAREFDVAMRRAQSVARVAANLKQLGFTPDVILGHEGWGEMMNLPDVWPDTPAIGYREFFYSLHGADVDFDPEFTTDPGDYSRIRAKNAVGLLALNGNAHGQTPTRWQLSTYPDWSQPSIALLPEGVDLDACRPDPAARTRPFALGDVRVAPGAPLVTYVARDLEPYRGFHVMMRALPAILAVRPDAQVVLVGGDGVSYGGPLAQGSWREIMLRELEGRLDLRRVHFPGKIPYAAYLHLLQRSDAHVYLTYPFVLSWSLREALACGCAVVASDTAPVTEFVANGKNGLLTPCLDPARLAERVLDLLGSPALNARLRKGARATAEAQMRLGEYLEGYRALIRRVTNGG